MATNSERQEPSGQQWKPFFDNEEGTKLCQNGTRKDNQHLEPFKSTKYTQCLKRPQQSAELPNNQQLTERDSFITMTNVGRF